MLELRKDYLTESYVIISTERGNRPHQFKKKFEDQVPEIDYFAPKNEHMTPDEIGRWPPDAKGGAWKIRWFENKFAAVKPKGTYGIRTDNDFFTFSDAFGYHEVIVESPDMEKQLADVDIKHLTQVLKIYSDRIKELSKREGIEYVAVFKNKGVSAGTSIYHTHSQVVAYNKVPETILEEERICQEHTVDPYERIINVERESFRSVKENKTMVCFCPYASKFPLEVMIFPKRFVLNITDFSEQEFKDLAGLLHFVLEKLKTINAPYNYFLHYGINKMRFHLTVAPRLATWAGFELSTGTVINTISPEGAARFYRGEDD